MEKSESIKEIAIALSKFQGEFKYAPLGLAKYGLAIVQAPYTEGENIIVETFLLHNSGEWIKTPPLSLKMERLTAQGAGSAITYARRYALSALLNISSEEDIDGNFTESENVEQPTEIQEEPVTEKQIKYIHVLAKEKGIDNTSLKNYSKALFTKESSKELTKKEASSLIEALQIIGAQPANMAEEKIAKNWLTYPYFDNNIY